MLSDCWHDSVLSWFDAQFRILDPLPFHIQHVRSTAGNILAKPNSRKPGDKQVKLCVRHLLAGYVREHKHQKSGSNLRVFGKRSRINPGKVHQQIASINRQSLDPGHGCNAVGNGPWRSPLAATMIENNGDDRRQMAGPAFGDKGVFGPDRHSIPQ